MVSSGNKYPSSWNSPALKGLLESDPINQSNQTTLNSTVLPNSASSTISASRSRLSHSVVAGIVVGCVGVVLCAIGATFMVKHQFRKTEPIVLPNGSAWIPFPESQLRGLPAESRIPELPSQYTDRAELPAHASSVEIGAIEPIGAELSTSRHG